MSYITDFHKAHDAATSQNVKDWLLIKAVAREVSIGLFRVLTYTILYPFIVLGIGIFEAIKEIIGALLAWPAAIWDEGLRKIFVSLRALRHIRNPVLPVNRKVTLCRERPE